MLPTDPYEQAIELWLDGDDEQSLPALAELAQEGNSGARIVLARIESLDRGMSPFRLGLTREQSIRLFRQPSNASPFGRNWLAIEAERGNELARLLKRSREPHVDLDLLAQLHAAGEDEAGDYPTRIVALYGTRQQREALLASPHVLDDLKPYLRYLIETSEPRSDGLEALRHITAGAKRVSAEDPHTYEMAEMLALGFWFGDYRAPNPWRPVLVDWLFSSPSARPIANLCENRCPHARDDCGLTFLALVGGYYEAIRLDTPVERYIPQPRFLNSKRAAQMTLRRAALMKNEPGTDLANLQDIAAHNQCAADLVAAERALY